MSISEHHGNGKTLGELKNSKLGYFLTGLLSLAYCVARLTLLAFMAFDSITRGTWQVCAPGHPAVATL